LNNEGEIMPYNEDL